MSTFARSLYLTDFLPLSEQPSRNFCIEQLHRVSKGREYKGEGHASAAASPSRGCPVCLHQRAAQCACHLHTPAGFSQAQLDWQKACSSENKAPLRGDRTRAVQVQVV